MRSGTLVAHGAALPFAFDFVEARRGELDSTPRLRRTTRKSPPPVRFT